MTTELVHVISVKTGEKAAVLIKPNKWMMARTGLGPDEVNKVADLYRVNDDMEETRENVDRKIVNGKEAWVVEGSGEVFESIERSSLPD